MTIGSPEGGHPSPGLAPARARPALPAPGRNRDRRATPGTHRAVPGAAVPGAGRRPRDRPEMVLPTRAPHPRLGQPVRGCHGTAYSPARLAAGHRAAAQHRASVGPVRLNALKATV